MSDAVFSFTNNARIPDDIPYSPVGKAEPILNDTRSSMKKGLEESARKSRQRTFQRTFDRPKSYRQDLDIAQDDSSGNKSSRKKRKKLNNGSQRANQMQNLARKKLKVQKLGDSLEKQERLRQHQEKFIQRNRKTSDHRQSYEKNSSISEVKGYFFGE